MNENEDDSLWKLYVKNVNPIQNNKVAFIYSTPEHSLSHNNCNVSRNIPCKTNDFIKSKKDLCQVVYAEIKQGIFRPIDGNTKIKIDSGKYPIDQYLDLHGCDLERAYDLVVDFIIKNYHVHNRCILIITGHGSRRSNKGIIKNVLYKWLQSDKVNEYILYYTISIKKHGGEGAFYVLLRRNRNNT